MKAKKDFYTQEEYYEYMLHYYAGLAMQGILSNSNRQGSVSELSELAIAASYILLNDLNISKQ